MSITREQAEEVVKRFDRNKDGQIHFNEFIRFLRGEINAFWQNLILKAYKKLDVNRDGLVKLDDIAKIYDASKHPDVQMGWSTPEDVYLEFMSMWDTQEVDGIITLEEFFDYFKDISASVDSDEYFEAIMWSAWKI